MAYDGGPAPGMGPNDFNNPHINNPFFPPTPRK